MEIIRVARFYWPADTQVQPVPLPVSYTCQRQSVPVQVVDISPGVDSVRELLISPLNAKRWLHRQGGASDTWCGVIIDNGCSDGHPDNSDIRRLSLSLKQGLAGLPAINHHQFGDAEDATRFFEQMSLCHELNQIMLGNPARSDLVEFHTRYKMLFLAHSQPAYRRLGPLVAGIKAYDSLKEFADQYLQKCLSLLVCPATRQNHTNVLMHMQGYFRNNVSDAGRQQLTESIHDYHQNRCELEEVKNQLRQLLNTAPHQWLLAQRYLYPWLS